MLIVEFRLEFWLILKKFYKRVIVDFVYDLIEVRFLDGFLKVGILLKVLFVFLFSFKFSNLFVKVVDSK